MEVLTTICHKISRSDGIIAKMRHYLPRNLLLNLSHALIFSVFDIFEGSSGRVSHQIYFFFFFISRVNIATLYLVLGWV